MPGIKVGPLLGCFYGLSGGATAHRARALLLVLTVVLAAAGCGDDGGGGGY
ncbi:MAG: hypothetical protein WA982_08910 [Rubrobacteraceae bacterium]